QPGSQDSIHYLQRFQELIGRFPISRHYAPEGSLQTIMEALQIVDAVLAARLDVVVVNWAFQFGEFLVQGFGLFQNRFVGDVDLAIRIFVGSENVLQVGVLLVEAAYPVQSLVQRGDLITELKS